MISSATGSHLARGFNQLVLSELHIPAVGYRSCRECFRGFRVEACPGLVLGHRLAKSVQGAIRAETDAGLVGHALRESAHHPRVGRVKVTRNHFRVCWLASRLELHEALDGGIERELNGLPRFVWTPTAFFSKAIRGGDGSTAVHGDIEGYQRKCLCEMSGSPDCAGSRNETEGHPEPRLSEHPHPLESFFDRPSVYRSVKSDICRRSAAHDP
ncbi:MAG: hypothetical protein P8127_16145, partial [Acidobacteriota bacterium]